MAKKQVAADAAQPELEAHVPSMSETSVAVIADVRRLQQELDGKRKTAISALLEQRAEIDATLISLGHMLTDATPTRRRQSKSPAERHCNICDVTGHDARAHKGQAKKKKFSPDELAAFHLA
jgi:hypothetical protein